jgi:hypothetical protein
VEGFVRFAAALREIGSVIVETCQLVKSDTMRVCAYSIDLGFRVKLGWKRSTAVGPAPGSTQGTKIYRPGNDYLSQCIIREAGRQVSGTLVTQITPTGFAVTDRSVRCRGDHGVPLGSGLPQYFEGW